MSQELEKRVLVNPQLSANQTCIDQLTNRIEDYIHSSLKHTTYHNANRLITDKYVASISHLHYIVYSINDAWQNGFREYFVYRDYFQQLNAIKFNLFAQARLLYINIHINYIYDGLVNIYSIIDSLQECNKENEQAFAGIDSEIYLK